MNSQNMGQPDKERQHKTQGFLCKISKSYGTNLSQGQWVLSENYDYLNKTQLLDLYCSVVQFIACDYGSMVVVYHSNHFWFITGFYRIKTV